jgi:streptogramin lyase
MVTGSPIVFERLSVSDLVHALMPNRRRSVALSCLLAAACLTSILFPLGASADPLGQFTEYRAGLSGDPHDLTIGPEGNLWFVERQTPAIGRITPSGVITEFTAGLKPNSGPTDIVVGPDGNLWFTDPDYVGNETGAIGRITPSGVITEFSAGLAEHEKPSMIVPGPEGDLWYAGFSIAIGKITTAGVITDLTGQLNQGLEPEEFRRPDSLAVGPDGDLWFGNYSEDGSAIGRLTPGTNQVAEFPVPNFGVPGGVIAGGDGNVWFYDEGHETIDRITHAGIITEFSTGAIDDFLTEVQRPSSLALGPEGNVWFAYYGVGFSTPPPSYIGNITPAGTVTKFTAGLRPNSQPGDLTLGPDGNLWFANGEVGRITPAGTIDEFAAPGEFVGVREIAPGPDGNMWFDEGEGGGVIGKIGTEGSHPAPSPSPSGGGTGSGTATPTAATVPSHAPSGALKLAGTKLLLKKGVAGLQVTFPGPGKLRVTGKGIAKLTMTIKVAGKAKVGLKPTAKTLSKLKSKGKVSLPIKLTFTPTGGPPHTMSTTLILKA